MSNAWRLHSLVVRLARLRTLLSSEKFKAPGVSHGAIPAPQRGTSMAAREAHATPFTFWFDSLFLRHCLGELAVGPDEALVMVTGLRGRSMRVPCHLVRPAFTYATVAGVEADHRSSHEVLCNFQETGHALLCVLHVHPGSGRNAVTPSSVDIAAQERLEQAGYQSIGGIFSRDGYVRFFSNRIPFAIRTFGSNLVVADENLLKLS